MGNGATTPSLVVCLALIQSPAESEISDLRDVFLGAAPLIFQIDSETYRSF